MGVLDSVIGVRRAQSEVSTVVLVIVVSVIWLGDHVVIL